MTPRNFLLIFLALLLVAPACAYEITAEPLGGRLKVFELGDSLSYDGTPDGDAIQRFWVDLPSGATVNFTLTYGDGATVEGWMIYENDGAFSQHTEVAIGGVVSGYDYVGLQEIGRVDVVGYARNATSADTYDEGILIFDSVAGISDLRRGVAFYPVSSGSIAIYKVEFTANQPVYSYAYVNTRENVAKAARTTITESAADAVAQVQKYAGTAWDFITTTFYWLKFFFIDNIILVFSLYIAVTMAFAARASRGNMARFLSKFFGYQRALIEFVFFVWRMLLETIGTVRGWFRL